MKKAYVKPLMESETFVPNDYVAVCFTLWCTLPGRNPNTQDGDYPWYTEHGNGAQHGVCANGANFNPNNRYEIEHPTAYVDNVIINGMRIDDPNATYDNLEDGKTYHNATWYSHLDGVVYHHRGDAQMDRSSNAS